MYKNAILLLSITFLLVGCSSTNGIDKKLWKDSQSALNNIHNCYISNDNCDRDELTILISEYRELHTAKSDNYDDAEIDLIISVSGLYRNLSSIETHSLLNNEMEVENLREEYLLLYASLVEENKFKKP